MDTSKNTDINIVKYKGFDSIYEKVEVDRWVLKNEGYKYENTLLEDNTSSYFKNNVKKNEDPQVGFDSYGNLVMNKGCVYVPRGGWKDANDNYFTATPESGKLGPLNIFFDSPVSNSSYNIEMQRKLNKLMK